MKKQRTVIMMLVVAGTLFLAGLATRSPAQQPIGANGACCLPTGGCSAETPEACNVLGGTFLGDFTTCAGSVGPSVALPTVVGVSLESNSIIRVWSDGQTDRLSFNRAVVCDPATVCVLLAGTCPTDIDRNGDTGINDFLALLGGWGPCR